MLRGSTALFYSFYPRKNRTSLFLESILLPFDLGEGTPRQAQLHKLLPLDLGEGTPLTRISFTQTNTFQAHLLELQHNE